MFWFANGSGDADARAVIVTQLRSESFVVKKIRMRKDSGTRCLNESRSPEKCSINKVNWSKRENFYSGAMRSLGEWPMVGQFL